MASLDFLIRVMASRSSPTRATLGRNSLLRATASRASLIPDAACRGSLIRDTVGRSSLIGATYRLSTPSPASALPRLRHLALLAASWPTRATSGPLLVRPTGARAAAQIPAVVVARQPGQRRARPARARRPATSRPTHRLPARTPRRGRAVPTPPPAEKGPA